MRLKSKVIPDLQGKITACYDKAETWGSVENKGKKGMKFTVISY